MTDNTLLPLRIERMPNGGFTVADAGYGDPSRYCATLFASTSIGEALAFIAGRLDPEAYKALQEQQAKAAHDAKVDKVSTDLRAEKMRQEQEMSRDFAKSREAPNRICNTCGVRPSEQAGGCRICGRGVGVFRSDYVGEWQGA